jgi:hypothetical protein
MPSLLRSGSDGEGTAVTVMFRDADLRFLTEL